MFDSHHRTNVCLRSDVFNVHQTLLAEFRTLYLARWAPVPLGSLEVALAPFSIPVFVLYDVAADDSSRRVFRFGSCFPNLSSNFLRARRT